MSTSTSPERTDVLVVGGGPAGAAKKNNKKNIKYKKW